MGSTQPTRVNIVKATAMRKPVQRSPYEVAIAVGMVGCLSGPKDLAKNRKKYLRAAARAKRTA